MKATSTSRLLSALVFLFLFITLFPQCEWFGTESHPSDDGVCMGLWKLCEATHVYVVDRCDEYTHDGCHLFWECRDGNPMDGFVVLVFSGCLLAALMARQAFKPDPHFYEVWPVVSALAWIATYVFLFGTAFAFVHGPGWCFVLFLMAYAGVLLRLYLVNTSHPPPSRQVQVGHVPMRGVLLLVTLLMVLACSSYGWFRQQDYLAYYSRLFIALLNLPAFYYGALVQFRWQMNKPVQTYRCCVKLMAAGFSAWAITIVDTGEDLNYGYGWPFYVFLLALILCGVVTHRLRVAVQAAIRPGTTRC
jgi:hypothetical protein